MNGDKNNVQNSQMPATPGSTPPLPQTTSPAITSKNVAAAPIVAPAVMIPDDEIVARPLVDDDFTKLKPRNPNLVFRWGNRVAGSGARFDQLKAQGFEVAMLADVAGSTPDSMKKDGHIVNGDLILMKIDRVKYVGATKHNEQRAMQRLNRSSVLQHGKDNMKTALNEVEGSAENKGKVSLYLPPQ